MASNAAILGDPLRLAQYTDGWWQSEEPPPLQHSAPRCSAGGKHATLCSLRDTLCIAVPFHGGPAPCPGREPEVFFSSGQRPSDELDMWCWKDDGPRGRPMHECLPTSRVPPLPRGFLTGRAVRYALAVNASSSPVGGRELPLRGLVHLALLYEEALRCRGDPAGMVGFWERSNGLGLTAEGELCFYHRCQAPCCGRFFPVSTAINGSLFWCPSRRCQEMKYGMKYPCVWWKLRCDKNDEWWRYSRALHLSSSEVQRWKVMVCVMQRFSTPAAGALCLPIEIWHLILWLAADFTAACVLAPRDAIYPNIIMQ